jgi:hypothetical protein
MKYRIIGVDGNTYGPVGLEQIRQWLAEGRVDNRTPIYVEGATNWTYLGLLPELAAAFTQSPPAIGALRPAASSRGTNGLATAGLICALLSWLCCCCVPLNLLALVFSIVALVQISSQAEPQEGRALAIAGLVISGLNLLFNAGLAVSMALNPAAFNLQNQFQ